MPFFDEELKNLSKQILEKALLRQQPVIGGGTNPLPGLRKAIQKRRQELGTQTTIR